MITVAPGRFDGRTILFEIDSAHPKGEIFLWGDEKCLPEQVGETQRVMECIGQGSLVRVDTPAANPPPDGGKGSKG